MIRFDFDPATHHSVPTLNDLSEDHLAEMRRLEDKDAKVALMYLCHIVERCDIGTAGRFMDDVLFRSADARDWGRGDRLVLPSLSLIDNVCLPLEEMLAPLRTFDRNAWVRVRPSLPARDDRFCGAPGAVTGSQPYWYLPPAIGYTAVLLPDVRDDLEPMTDLMITGRRWLASRIAERLSWRALPGSAAELAAALRAAGPVTRDAEIALAALHREASLDAAGRMPGFRGPDDWFA